MLPSNFIRSCQKFPSVIPVLRVSPLRVTHPSAMVPNIASYIFPINLHVLSILSAFILSQDQTLHSISFLTFFFSYYYTLLCFSVFFSYSSYLYVFHCPRQPLPQLTKIILPNLHPCCQAVFLLFLLNNIILSS